MQKINISVVWCTQILKRMNTTGIGYRSYSTHFVENYLLKTKNTRTIFFMISIFIKHNFGFFLMLKETKTRKLYNQLN